MRVADSHDPPFDQPEQPPAQLGAFAVNNVLLNYTLRVFKRGQRFGEADTVLLNVGSLFPAVPFKDHTATLGGPI